jgi:hypothetical protein
MLSDDAIKAIVLFKLHKRGNWGASHTAFDNLKKGFRDDDLGKHAAKRVDKLAKELVGLWSSLHTTERRSPLIQGNTRL